MTPYSQHIGSKQNEPPFQNSGSSGSLGAGVFLSVGLHAVLIGFIIFGLPIFWQPEVLPGAIGIELAQLSDITAAPRVQKEGKPNEQRSPSPSRKCRKRNRRRKPRRHRLRPRRRLLQRHRLRRSLRKSPRRSPIRRRKEEGRAKEERGREKEEGRGKEKEGSREKEEGRREKKQQKKDDEALEAMLANLTPDKPAPETDKKPEKKKAEAKPAEPSTGPQTELASEVALTASEEDGIRGQIEKVWNLGSLAGSPDLAGLVIELRITLQPDGTVTRVDVLNMSPSPFFGPAADSARRAVMIASPLKLPPGKTYDTMRLRFYPDQVDAVLQRCLRRAGGSARSPKLLLAADLLALRC